MKYIKKFATNQEYEDFIMSELYVTPNISKVTESNSNTIKYDEDIAYVEVTMNVPSTDSPLTVAYSDNNIKEILIDDGTILTPLSTTPHTLSCQFSTTGLHTLKVKFKKINGLYVMTNTFGGNGNITKISIPGIYTLANGALGGVYNLEELTLPGNLKIIPQSLLGGCSKLKSLTIPNTVERIEEGALNGTGIEEIIIPNSVTY